MKAKIFIFICIIFVILSFSSVCASEDVSDNSTEECLGIQEMDAVESTHVENENFSVEVMDEHYLEYDDGLVYVKIKNNDNVKGNITVEIDNEIYYNKSITAILDGIDEPEISNYFIISTGELNKKLSFGTHNIIVKHIWDNTERVLVNTTFKSTYYFNIYELVIPYGDEGRLDILLPKDATGTLTVTFNGKKYNLNYKNGKASLKIPSSNLKLGEYEVTGNLTGDKNYPDLDTSSKITIIPKFTDDFGSWYVSTVGEKDYITVKVPKGSSGTFKIYDSVIKKEYIGEERSYVDSYFKGSKVLASAKIVNGYAKIPTSKFSQGNHVLFLEYKSGNYVYDEEFDLKIIKKNSPQIKVSLSSQSIYEGGKVKLTVKSPKIPQSMYVVVDNGEQKMIDLIKGKSSKYLTKLKPGTHTVKVYTYDGSSKYVYSKTFKIKVKEKITIKAKNLVVKKSAKKFKIKATLKIKGKIAKSKKLTFKINGKNFKAKTNKKGVATLTLKKNVLKNVKRGEKIKYQITYSKKTVNKYLKVK